MIFHHHGARDYRNFEYGMLKIRNHADGFEDTVDSSVQDLDTEMFKMTMPRSE